MQKHRVFVYGTLKRGYENHPLLKDALFFGEGVTLARFRMLDGQYPVVRDIGSDTYRIAGEIYDVCDKTLRNLDELEGVAEGIYDRREVQIEMHVSPLSGGQTCSAFIYVGCGDYWDHRSSLLCVALNARGHIDWPNPLSLADVRLDHPAPLSLPKTK